MLLELRSLLRNKSEYSQRKINQVVRDIKGSSQIVKPMKKVHVVRHESDNKIIECAVEGKCEVIITGDKDLLVLKKYKKIKILTPSEFLDVFEGK